MAFIGSMFSNSNGAGYDATAMQGGALGQAAAASAAQLGGVNQQLQNQATNGSTLAQNQLTAATGQNVQNAQGMISSQKGLNPAMAARQGVESATAANQQAGNQSAQLQAQTQMAAQNSLSSNLLGQQQIDQGAIANQNNNQTLIAQGNQKTQAATFGGLTNGLGGLVAMAKGGQVTQMYADGTPPGGAVAIPAQANPVVPGSPIPQTSGPKSMAGKFFKGMTSAQAGQGGAPQDPVMTGVSNLTTALGNRAKQAVGLGPSTPAQQAAAPVAAPVQLVAQPGALPPAPPADAPANPTPEFADGGDVASTIEAGGAAAANQDPNKDPVEQGTSNLVKGIGSALVGGMAKGGNVGKLVSTLAMAKGGTVAERKAKIEAIIKKHMAANPQTPVANTSVSQQLAPDSAVMAKGGKVKAMLSPGERYLPPSEAKQVVEGKKDAMKAGKKVPGKPVVGGAKNSYANDNVPATLEAGGIVIPRSVTQQKDPQMAAHAFVAAHFKQKGGLPGKKAK